MIGEQLRRDGVDDGGQKIRGCGHRDLCPGALGRCLETLLAGDQQHLARSSHDFLHIGDRFIEKRIHRGHDHHRHVFINERDGSMFQFA